MRPVGVKLSLKEIADSYIRENFKRLQDYFDGVNSSEEFQAVDLQVQSAVTELKIRLPSGSGVPKDIILTKLIASSGVKLRFHWGLFTDGQIVVSTTGAARARFLVGTAKNELAIQDGQVTAAETDKQEYTA